MVDYDPDNQMAFPGSPTHINNIGLTKREYFAAQALLTFKEQYGSQGIETPQKLACEAVALADALMAALNAEKP